MKIYKNNNRGFIGLISLLIMVTIIFFWFIQIQKKDSPTNVSRETGKGSINAAENLKINIEQPKEY